MKFLLIAAVLSLAAGPVIVFADLGDNELKISQTYGDHKSEQKLSPSLVERQYLFNGLAVTVIFLNGTSQCEVFRKTDGAALTDDQIGKMLEANGNRLLWTPKASAAQNTREWITAGPKPAAPETSGDPAVFAVAGRTPPSRGEKLIAVDMLDTADHSSSAPSAPPVLRRAVYVQETTNNVLKIFTAAYANVAKHELSPKSSLPVPEK